MLTHSTFPSIRNSLILLQSPFGCQAPLVLSLWPDLGGLTLGPPLLPPRGFCLYPQGLSCVSARRPQKSWEGLRDWLLSDLASSGWQRGQSPRRRWPVAHSLATGTTWGSVLLSQAQLPGPEEMRQVSWFSSERAGWPWAAASSHQAAEVPAGRVRLQPLFPPEG